jgi:hypothetical protein
MFRRGRVCCMERIGLFKRGKGPNNKGKKVFMEKMCGSKKKNGWLYGGQGVVIRRGEDFLGR